MPDDGAIQRAAADLSLIRMQLTRSATFRGYRTLTVASSGFVGILSATLQAYLLPEPAAYPQYFVALWCIAAAVCLAAAGADMLVDLKRTQSSLAKTLTRQAVGHFLPSLVLGAGVTFAVALRYSETMSVTVSLLPGIWALLFALGCFASAPVLPRVAVLSGYWYGIAGILAIFWHDLALDPWCMGTIFGGGQLLTTFWLYWYLERKHGT